MNATEIVVQRVVRIAGTLIALLIIRRFTDSVVILLASAVLIFIALSFGLELLGRRRRQRRG